MTTSALSLAPRTRPTLLSISRCVDTQLHLYTQVCMDAHACIRAYAHGHRRTRTDLQGEKYACKHARACTRAKVWTCAQTYTDVRSQEETRVRTYVCTRITCHLLRGYTVTHCIAMTWTTRPAPSRHRHPGNAVLSLILAQSQSTQTRLCSLADGPDRRMREGQRRHLPHPTHPSGLGVSGASSE